MDKDNRHNSNNNNYKRRSSKYNKNYKNSGKKNNKNYKSNNKHRNENYRKNLDDVDFNITKQQVFDFDEMKFSDEIDTSFVENKRKKKEKIVDELVESYEKGRVSQQKRENKQQAKIHVGRLLAFIIILILLLALLIVCFYILTKPLEKLL